MEPIAPGEEPAVAQPVAHAQQPVSEPFMESAQQPVSEQPSAPALPSVFSEQSAAPTQQPIYAEEPIVPTQSTAYSEQHIMPTQQPTAFAENLTESFAVTQIEEDQTNENITEPGTDAPKHTPAPKRAPRQSLPSEKGTTVFPMARVSKIIKADTAVDICSKEATFLISAATELFVKKFVEEGYTNARLDKRKMIRYNDMARAVQQNGYFDFLQEVVPMPVPLSAALQRREELTEKDGAPKDFELDVSTTDAAPDSNGPVEAVQTTAQSVPAAEESTVQAALDAPPTQSIEAPVADASYERFTW
ncbi:DNA-directed DNA polymerase [Malassezia vespertilionis]|uniref:DNA-directed DNA polymerase n=1 Tax=Malassezia vespertilionis TaxID=2020962 RepID=UPI0024B0CBF2|nr:DNA-directed DNA polymerase [Malassezia vespertilionis]WFD07298.1 DNA-directed DNA polymerase [Malassezia vespertilionis]